MAKRNSKRRKLNQVKRDLERQGMLPGNAEMKARRLTGIGGNRLAITQLVEGMVKSELNVPIEPNPLIKDEG